MEMNEKQLRENLQELIELWNENIKVCQMLGFRDSLEEIPTYQECIEDLTKILEGNLSPIAKL